MTYQLRQFTEESFVATKENWQGIAGEDEFMSEFGVVFEWLGDNRDYANGGKAGNSLGYGLFYGENGHACALAEVVARPMVRGGLTKLLKVLITPEYWNIEEHAARIVDIYSAAILGTIELSEAVQARTIKLYGRGDQMMKLLRSINDSVNKRFSESAGGRIKSAMKGQWLEISIN